MHPRSTHPRYVTAMIRANDISASGDSNAPSERGKTHLYVALILALRRLSRSSHTHADAAMPIHEIVYSNRYRDTEFEYRYVKMA